MRGGAIHNRTTFVILCNASMKINEQPARLQLLTLYLTLTPIFSGRKAKINLHMTPKLTVVMPISCLLHLSIQFPSQQNDAITSCTCAYFPANFVVCFQLSPAIKSFLELTDCCLAFAIRLCFLQSPNKDSTISFCWWSFLFLSKPF